MTYSNQNKPINPAQFKQMVPSLPDPMLNQLITQAQLKGIPQSDIDEGLRIINQFRNRPY